MRVMVVEDHWVWADAVVHQLGQMPGMTSVGVAHDQAQALELAERERPDLALVDLLLGADSGLDVARTLRLRLPAIRVVIVTAEPSPYALREAREAGVAGFVSKDDLTSADELRRVLEAVTAGGSSFSAGALALETPGGPGAALGLDDTDIELIRLFRRGLDTGEICATLHLARQTVNNRTQRMGAKLGVSGRLAIVAAALRLGVISEGRAPGPDSDDSEPPAQ